MDTTWETPLLSALARAQEAVGDTLDAFGLVGRPLQYKMVISSDGRLMSADLELSGHVRTNFWTNGYPSTKTLLSVPNDLFEIEQMAERMAWSDHGDTGIAVDLSAPWMR